MEREVQKTEKAAQEKPEVLETYLQLLANSTYKGLKTDEKRITPPTLPSLQIIDQTETNSGAQKTDSAQRKEKAKEKAKHEHRYELEPWTIPIGANSDNKKKSVPMEEIKKPEDQLPNAWEQPAASFMDGKCGMTGVANMLRFYGVEKDPKELDSYDYRSWGPGMRADKFKENLNLLSEKNFSAYSLSEADDALATLRKHINEGKPVAIQFMTGPTNAHWVVVSGIKDEKSGPELQVLSWGTYYKIKWDDVAEAWKRGYGGPYPHVVCDSASNLLKRSAK